MDYFLQFEYADPLDILSDIPYPFGELKEITAYTGFPSHSVVEKNTLEKKSISSKKEQTRVLDVLIDKDIKNRLTEQLRNVKSLKEDYLLSAAKIVDPYFNLSDRAIGRFDNYLSRNTLAIYAINVVFSIFDNRDPTMCYLCMGEGPGGWIEFIQSEVPTSQGFAMTLNQKDEKDWNFDQIDIQTLQFLYGKTHNGNIEENHDWLIDYVQEKSKPLDLVTCDFFSSKTLPLVAITALTLLRKQEIKEFTVDYIQPLSFEERISPDVNRKVKRPGGNLVLRLEDTTSPKVVRILYLIARCFEKSYIYKPITSEPWSSVRYLICKGFINGSEEIEAIEKKTIVEIDEVFISWLRASNDKLGKRQSLVLEDILKYPNTPYAAKKDLSRLMIALGVRGSSEVNIY